MKPAISFIVLFLPSLAAGQGIFPAGAFDRAQELPAAWWVRDRENTRLVREDGGAYVRFHNGDASKIVNIGTSLELKPEWKKIRLSLRLRTKEVRAGREAWHAATVMLRFEDGAKKLIPPYPPKPVQSGDQGWTEWKEILNIPEKATVLKIEPGLFFATGEMDLDDIRVEPMDASGALLAVAETPRAAASPSGAMALGPSFLPEVQQQLIALEGRVTGAKIDESAVKVTLWVDARAAGGGDGSAGKPFRTVSDGLSASAGPLKEGLGVRLRIMPGVYREGSLVVRGSLIGGLAQETLFIIEGTEAGAAVLSGADLYAPDEWKASAGHPGVWEREWPHALGLYGTAFGNMSPRKAIGHRREMLFLDGELVTPRMLEEWEVQLPSGTSGRPAYEFRRTLGPGALAPHCFGVTEQEAPKRIYFRPDGLKSLSGHTLEAAVRPFAFDIREKNHLVLRNLVFRHYAGVLSSQSDPNEAAVALFAPMKQVLIERCDFEWNNAMGLRVYSAENLTVKDGRFRYNGTCGISGNKLVQSLFTGNTVAFNAWRAFMGGTVGWWVAGAKFAGTVDMIWRSNTLAWNTGRGLWFDIGNQGVLIEDHLSLGSIRGVFSEISEGPVFIRRSLLAASRNSCLQAESTKNVHVAETIVYGTHSAGMKIPMYKRAAKNMSVDRPGAVSVMNSILVAASSASTALSESVWPKTGSREGDAEALAGYFIGSQNTWFGPDPKVIKVVSAQVDGGLKDLETWGRLRKETGSRFQDPGFVNPGALDFRFRGDSPYAPYASRYLAMKVPEALIRDGEAFLSLTRRLDPPGFEFTRDDFQEEKNNF